MKIVGKDIQVECFWVSAVNVRLVTQTVPPGADFLVKPFPGRRARMLTVEAAKPVLERRAEARWENEGGAITTEPAKNQFEEDESDDKQ